MLILTGNRGSVRTAARASLCLLLLAAFGFRASAQDFEHLHPKQLPQTNLPPPPANAPIPVTEGDDTEIAAALKGIVLVSDGKKVKADGVNPKIFKGPAQGIAFDETFSEADQKGLREALIGYVGKPVSMQKLNEVLREIILYYRRGDRPLIDPYLPEQDMAGDVVQIVVRQAKRGKVLTEGNKYFSNDLLTSYIRTPEGASFHTDAINSDVSWLNRNPFLQSTLVYQAGEEPGTTDIVLKTQDRSPFRFYTGYEDTGSTLTGDGRLEAGFNWGNAFGVGDQFNYQYTTSDDLELVRAHSATYTHFFPWHHLLNIVGTYADSKASFPAYLPLQSSGDAWQIGARYTIPLPDLKPFGLGFSHEATLGYDFKESSSQLLFNQVLLDTNSPTTQVSEFSIGYNFSVTDPYGITSLSNSVFYNPGYLVSHDDAVDYAGANASGPRYAYYRLAFSRTTPLPAGYSFIVKGSYQATNERLLGSEQMGIGGYDTVRGYEMREANGDEGYFVSGEVRTPGWSLAKLVKPDYEDDRIVLLAFMDYGGVSQYRPDSTNLAGTPSTNPNVNLWSVGPGFRYTINPYFSIRFDYGWQLINSGIDDTFRKQEGSRGHLGLTLSY